MNRVYLLLRDNIQSGPYAYDELLQQQLLASDLIWVEGKSTAWAYPYEIEDLKGSLTGQSVEIISLPSVMPVAVKTEKPVIDKPETAMEKDLPKIPAKPVKKRKDEIELRAEELRKKALAFSQYHVNHQVGSFHESDEFRPYVKENDAVYLVHHKNDRRAPVGEILVAAMVIGLVVLGWYGGADKYFFQRRSPAINTVASQMVTSDMHAAALNSKDQPVHVTDTTKVVSADSTVNTAGVNYSAGYTTNHVTTQKNTYVIPADSQLVLNQSSDLATETPKKEIEKPVVTEKKKPESENEENDTTDKSDKKAVAEIKKTEAEKNVQSQQAQVKEEDDKKKGLGGVLKGLFKKKKKDKD